MRKVKLGVMGIFVVVFTGIFLCKGEIQAADGEREVIEGVNFAMPSVRDAQENTSYASGELIVKLKKDKTIEDIKELNSKYSVYSIEEIFKDMPNRDDILKTLKDKLSGLSEKHDGWYWQLDKNSQEYKDYIAQIEKEKEELQKQIREEEEFIEHLKTRQKRAHQDIIPPDLTSTYLLTVDKETDITLMDADYSTHPFVEYAEPNYIVKLKKVPNDYMYDFQWAPQSINLEKAWDISMGDNKVIIAIVDSGVDYNHEDLALNIWCNTDEIADNSLDDDKNGYKDDYYGYDFCNGDGDPKDDNGHGTHCAGIAAAVTNNNKGVAGVCPGAKIMAVKFLREEGSGSLSAAGAAIVYAANNGADVISNSWGSYGYSYTLNNAVQYAYSQGCFLTAAAGNESASDILYPAGYENVVAAAAIDYKDKLTNFSNYGSWIDVAAPGVWILSTMPQYKVYMDRKNYAYCTGTSMASPHVAGQAALILSIHSGLTNKEVETLIKQSAYDVGGDGFDNYTGYGRIDVFKALQSVSGKPPQFSPIDDKTVDEGTVLQFTVSATDPDGDSLTYSASNLPQGATFVTQTFKWIPSYSQAGTYDVTFTAQNSKGEKASQTVKITVNNIVRRKPLFDEIGNKEVKEGKLLQFTVSINDDSGEEITYSASNLPRGATFVAQTFKWIPDYTQAGTYTVTFIAEGNEGSQDDKTITIKVIDCPIAPKVVIKAKPTMGNSPLKAAFSASYTPDGNSKIVSYLWNFGNGKTSTEISPKCTFKNSSWRKNKSYNVSLTVKDDKGMSGTATIKIKVYPAWQFWR